MMDMPPPEAMRDETVIARDLRDLTSIRMLMAFVLRQSSNCIDIGAHAGHVLSEMIRCAPDGHHIAFEPLPHLYEQLRATYPGVDVRRVALSNRSGRASFTHVTTNPAYSGFEHRAYPGDEVVEIIEVACEPLDEVLPDRYVPSLIKIDVEGAEQQVIEGAIQIIRAHQPVVVFEHGKGAAEHYGTSPGDIYELLNQQAGLRLFDLDGGGPYSQEDFCRSFAEGQRSNYVAHP